MRTRACSVLLTCSALLLLAGHPGLFGSAQEGEIAATHVAAARAAAYRPGHDFTRLFNQLCNERPPRRMRVEAGELVPESRNGSSAPRTVPSRDRWYQAPAKVFDNLYYVGSQNNSMWAVTTSEGIILLDTGFDYMVDAQIVDGLRALGLEPGDIRYVIVSHGHPDHFLGAGRLQDDYGASVLMSAEGWELVARDGSPSELKPRKDLVVTDGMELTLGATTLTLYVTPGHTPGTVSTIVPLNEGDRQHVGALWGGTAIGFRHFRDPIELLRIYGASARRFQNIAADAGADVHLSSHGEYDRTLEKLNALRFRNTGDPHPFVSPDAVGRYQTVLSECTDATLAWLTEARRQGMTLRHPIESGLR